MDISFYSPRKLKFKAWNHESKLLMRLNSIDCVKGELFKKDHVLLQFTGLFDKQDEEVYDMDVMLWNTVKFIMYWDEPKKRWRLTSLDLPAKEELNYDKVREMTRLCSYFESGHNVKP
jgi:hypothetical protein